MHSNPTDSEVLKKLSFCKKIIKKRLPLHKKIVESFSFKSTKLFLLILSIQTFTHFAPTFITVLLNLMILFNSVLYLMAYNRVSLCMILWYFYYIDKLIETGDIEDNENSLPSIYVSTDMTDFIFLKADDIKDVKYNDLIKIVSCKNSSSCVIFNPISIWFTYRFNFIEIWDFCKMSIKMVFDEDMEVSDNS